MEKSADEEECGICLDELTNPVALPCSHKFCSECLNGWRSKYGKAEECNRKCPLCREKIPPSKEMISQWKCLRIAKSQMEATGEVFSDEYMFAKSRLEELERDVEDWTETIDYSDVNKELPWDICVAAKNNSIQKVLDWLGPLPVDKQQINSKTPKAMNFTLVHFAATYKHTDLLSILLQLGADVDPVDAMGMTAIVQVGKDPECHAQARLLLEWGA